MLSKNVVSKWFLNLSAEDSPENLWGYLRTPSLRFCLIAGTFLVFISSGCLLKPRNKKSVPTETSAVILSSEEDAPVEPTGSSQSVPLDLENAPVSFRIEDSVAQSGSPLEFRFEISRILAEDLRVEFSVVSGSATAGVEFELPEFSSVVISAGSTSAKLQLITKVFETTPYQRTLVLKITVHDKIHLDKGEALGTISALPASLAPLLLKEIGAGNDHACGLTSLGGVKCWGDNSLGQLGESFIGSSSNVPVAVSPIGNVGSLVSGFDFSCALLQEGDPVCFGNNVFLQLGNFVLGGGN